MRGLGNIREWKRTWKLFQWKNQTGKKRESKKGVGFLSMWGI